MPITDFTRHYSKVSRELMKHGRPVVLTANGRPVMVVQDVATYEATLGIIDFLFSKNPSSSRTSGVRTKNGNKHANSGARSSAPKRRAAHSA